MDNLARIEPQIIYPSGICKISLTAFRSYDSLRLDCDSRPVVLTGSNGAGKTNILEAISLLSPGKGLRQATSAEVMNSNCQGQAWAVSVQVSSASGHHQIGFGLDPDALARGHERRILRIDGENIRTQGQIPQFVQVLWLTPVMDRLFIDTPSDRRRFLDRLVYGLYPDHATRLKNYELAMRQRLRLLKDGRREEVWLSSLESQMAVEGGALATARNKTVHLLSQYLSHAITGFPRANLQLSGWLDELIEEGMDLSDIEESFKDKLAENRAKDAIIGMTRVGPHRSDLGCKYVEKNMPAAQCSTGEQKALLLSVMLAAARMQLYQNKGVPVLLLDEVIAHLDPDRRIDLYNEIEALGLQVWMTGTDQKPFKGLGGRAQFFCVEKSNVYHKNVL